MPAVRGVIARLKVLLHAILTVWMCGTSRIGTVEFVLENLIYKQSRSVGALLSTYSFDAITFTMLVRPHTTCTSTTCHTHTTCLLPHHPLLSRSPFSSPNPSLMLARAASHNGFRRALSQVRCASGGDIFNPTDEHAFLRQTVRKFAEEEVLPQALVHDREGASLRTHIITTCGYLWLLLRPHDPRPTNPPLSTPHMFSP